MSLELHTVTVPEKITKSGSSTKNLVATDRVRIIVGEDDFVARVPAGETWEVTVGIVIKVSAV